VARDPPAKGPAWTWAEVALTGEYRLTGITKANDGVTAPTRFTRNKRLIPRSMIEREKAQLVHAAGVIEQPHRSGPKACHRSMVKPDVVSDVDASSNKEAINASGALKRPRRSSGGMTASTASSFSEASIRRYTSVVRMSA
jgi:hypothetical protein